MEPHEINNLLKSKSLNQHDIAKVANVNATLVCLIISGKRQGLGIKGQRVREAIARAVDLPVDDLWPPDERSSKAA